ncbi:hypothetical protein [Escherichia coli]|nr:hypothetical protein [Escherichia coli]
MAKAKVLINDTDEAVIKNALDVEDMNEVNINVREKRKLDF